MSITEQRITEDLAVLGRMSRERTVDVETTLRAVVAGPATVASDLGLLVLARVFVARVARAAAGVASLVGCGAILVWLGLPRDERWLDGFGREQGLGAVLLRGSRWWLGLLVVCVSVLAYVAGSRIAVRICERTAARARDPIGAVRRLAQDAGSWATAASIAGITTFVVVFGMFQVVVGEPGLASLYSRDDTIEMIRCLMEVSLDTAVSIIVSSAIAVVWIRGRACALRNPGWLIPAGLVLGFVTLSAGARLDVGPILESFSHNARPSVALRIILTGTGTAAVFMTVTGLVLRRRWREDAIIARVGHGAATEGGVTSLLPE